MLGATRHENCHCLPRPQIIIHFQCENCSLQSCRIQFFAFSSKNEKYFMTLNRKYDFNWHYNRPSSLLVWQFSVPQKYDFYWLQVSCNEGWIICVFVRVIGCGVSSFFFIKTKTITEIIFWCLFKQRVCSRRSFETLLTVVLFLTTNYYIVWWGGHSRIAQCASVWSLLHPRIIIHPGQLRFTFCVCGFADSQRGGRTRKLLLGWNGGEIRGLWRGRWVPSSCSPVPMLERERIFFRVWKVRRFLPRWSRWWRHNDSG